MATTMCRCCGISPCRLTERPWYFGNRLPPSRGSRLTSPAATCSLGTWRRCAVSRLEAAKRESGEICPHVAASRSRSCPRNCKRRAFLLNATGFSREGGAKAATRESGDLPAPVTLPMHGACTRGGFRSGDVLKTVAGLWVLIFPTNPTKASLRLRDMFNPLGACHVEPFLLS
jgi:hypothetical protein